MISPMATPNHCSLKGIQRNEPWLMQQRSMGAPGSDVHSMKSGTGSSADPCCRLVGLASFNDIASM